MVMLPHMPLNKPLTLGVVAPRAAGFDTTARRFNAAMAPASQAPAESGSAASQRTADPLADAHHPATDADPSGSSPVLHDLRQLWDELVQSLQAGRRLASDHWSLRLRLDEQAFPHTTLALVCAAGELSITLRTASDAVHQRLLAQMPELNERLKSHVATVDVALWHVPFDELDA